jgi:cation:H+ antiporter
MLAFAQFFFGLVIITIGAELLLRGAARIASLLGIKPIIIGLTVVSIGTSLPELAVGITAVKEGSADMAIGNIAGTNLVNLLMVLGLSAAIRPLPLIIKAIKFEMGVMIFAACLLLLLCIDGRLTVWDGAIMLICGLIYIISTVILSKKEPTSIKKEYAEEYEPSSKEEKSSFKIWLLQSVSLFIGIGATIFGADHLVEGATDIARLWGMSDAVIGLTIVAIGTSAPELITTLIATFKDDRDVAIGNLLGSSITNILFILGATVVLSQTSMSVADDILWFDLPLAALAAIVCYPVFKSDAQVSRKEGVSFLLTYIAYLIFLLYFRA